MAIVTQSKREVKLDIFDRTEAVRERNRKDVEGVPSRAIAAMTDRTVAEVEADLTAPDPCFGADYVSDDLPKCSYDDCHEPVFHPDLCWEHFIEEQDECNCILPEQHCPVCEAMAQTVYDNDDGELPF